MPIGKGTKVRQKVVVVEGTVIARQFNESQDQMEYLVESPDTDGDGVPQTRWFLEKDIEPVKAETPDQPTA